MSEIIYSPKLVQHAIGDLLELFREPMIGAGQVALYDEIAARLSAIVDKQPAWGWRYVHGVATGSMQPSKLMSRAVMAMVASMDGVPVEVADTEPVQIYARPGAVRAGSIVLGGSRMCDLPGCPVSFVPSVPWQKYHSPRCATAGRALARTQRRQAKAGMQ